MPKDVKDLAASRREEIVNACETLYKTKSFKDTPLRISAGRPRLRGLPFTIILKRKKKFFSPCLRGNICFGFAICKRCSAKAFLSRKEYAEALARSLQARPVMLKLLSVNMYEIEGNAALNVLPNSKRHTERP